MNKDKIVLIQPKAYSKYPGMPMGIIYTATSLQEDYEVSVYDYNAMPDKKNLTLNILEENQPAVVMIGGTSPSQPESYEIATSVKAFNKDILVIKGGPHELFFPHQTAKHPDIDFIIKGDGEASPLLLQKIKSGEQKEKVFVGITDLNKSKLPSRQLLYKKNQNYYDFLGLSTAQIRSFRGCTFKCNYCSQGKYREYPLNLIFRDIEQIDREGFKAIYWDDAIFTLKKERFTQILQFLEKYNFRKGCITRAGINTTKDVLKKMYGVGFRHIWFALESGDENIRHSLDRSGTGDDVVKEAVDTAKEVGLIPYVNIIIGCKGETEESILLTQKALIYIMPYGVSTSVFTIYPGIEGCDAETYEKPINRDKRLMHFDEGYGGKILVTPEQAEIWYFQIANEIQKYNIKMLDFKECKTPKVWDLPVTYFSPIFST